MAFIKANYPYQHEEASTDLFSLEYNFSTNTDEISFFESLFKRRYDIVKKLEVRKNNKTIEKYTYKGLSDFQTPFPPYKYSFFNAYTFIEASAVYFAKSDICVFFVGTPYQGKTSQFISSSLINNDVVLLNDDLTILNDNNHILQNLGLINIREESFKHFDLLYANLIPKYYTVSEDTGKCKYYSICEMFPDIKKESKPYFFQNFKFVILINNRLIVSKKYSITPILSHHDKIEIVYKYIFRFGGRTMPNLNFLKMVSSSNMLLLEYNLLYYSFHELADIIQKEIIIN